jgi:hypothetical protein
MNEFTELNQELARDLVRRHATPRTPIYSSAPHRRTARRSLAAGLHRLADRLES